MKNLVFILILFSNNLFAQDCEVKLENAKRAFFNGNFKEVTLLLNGCDQFRFDDQTDALELMIKSYVMLNDDDKADKYMFELLSYNPLFEARNTDLSAFKDLVSSYEIRTRYSIGIQLGLNIPDYTIMQYRSYGSLSDEPENYGSRNGIDIGLTGEYYLTKNVAATTAIHYQSQGYTQSEVILDYQQVAVSEKLSYLNIPLQLRYQMEFGGIIPFINAGIGIQYLLKSRGDLKLSNLPRNFPTAFLGEAHLIDNYDFSDQRKKLLLNYVFGFGVKKKLGLFNLELMIQYEYGLNNLVNDKNRYGDAVLLDTYSYVPDDFKMDKLSLSFGVSKLFVKPKKK